MKPVFDESAEYYVVKGWFEATNGLNGDSFYGAIATPDNLLCPQRVVLHGQEALKASEIAAGQPARVYPEEILVNEMTGSGAIAIRPAALQSPTNVSRFGMPDRGGHGHIKNLKRGKRGDSKQVKIGRNIKGGGRNRLRGFGNKAEVPTISQTGGRRGGNQ